MKNNIKVQALLSVNPSFNYDFISDHIYSHCLHRDFIATEPKSEAKTKNYNTDRKDRYINQKSEPASYQLKPNKMSRQLLEPLSVPRLREKSVSCYKLRASSMMKRNVNRVSQFAIDSKLQGNHVRIRHYRKWCNEK